MQLIKCGVNQNMWESSEQLGLDTYVQVYGNAKTNQPREIDVEKFGKPIGIVEIAEDEAYYVYNRKQ